MSHKNIYFFHHSQLNKGFTLVELLIVVVIVSLLAMVAVPSYNVSVAKARRADAQSSLSNLAGAMERFFTENGTYIGAAGSSGTPTATGAPWIYHTQSPIDGDIKFYNLTIETATAGAYTLRATPIGGQVGDGYMELLSTSVERWDRNNDGDTSDADEEHW
jgi:type IV pilus assembly protein PilE